jgi:hypothetical protein
VAVVQSFPTSHQRHHDHGVQKLLPTNASDADVSIINATVVGDGTSSLCFICNRQGQSGQKQQARCIRSRQLEFHQSSAADFTKLLSSASDCGEITHVLRKYGFGNRLVTLTNTDLSQRPMIAEIYAEGIMNICLIIRWVPPSSSTSTDAEKPPLLEVFVMNDDGMFKDRKVIDIGEPVFMLEMFFYVLTF